ncbi:hypothetical protein AAVH_19311 [Aphelenchoides avenae]|nr:hypothetical protein AAVH_19311 [Aphelenchus avenae]
MASALWCLFVVQIAIVAVCVGQFTDPDEAAADYETYCQCPCGASHAEKRMFPIHAARSGRSDPLSSYDNAYMQGYKAAYMNEPLIRFGKRDEEASPRSDEDKHVDKRRFRHLLGQKRRWRAA